VEISVLWSDGVVEGDPRLGADEMALDAGVERQLARILDILRAAARGPEAHPLKSLGAEIAALPIDVGVEDAAPVYATLKHPQVRTQSDLRLTMMAGMQKAKDAARTELEERLVRASFLVHSTYGEWLTALVTRFEAWRSRVVSVH
jgi:hypothetical protein